MLSFSTKVLLDGAAQVSDILDTDDHVWLEGDRQPLEGIRVTGRLSAAGEGRFYFNGRFNGSVLGECGRCLAERVQEVGGEAHLLFGDVESENEDDPDVFPLSHGRGGEQVDLRPALRELWLLEAPAFVLCRPDCKGWCPNCGADLNQGACSCARKPDE